MMRSKLYLVAVFFIAAVPFLAAGESWTIDTQAEWQAARSKMKNLILKDGAAIPAAKSAVFQSALKRFGEKRRVKSLVFEQLPLWQNWEPIANLGPSNLQDAPILLCVRPDDYWIFGRYGNPPGNRAKDFKPERTTLEGFDVPLQTTPFPRQYDAPGGLKKSLGGYHAWQSRDMKNWVHHGPVTEGFSRWATSAEYADGKAFIYYDYPNDQDPHLYIDEDLTDGQPGDNKGLAVPDPSHGSDSGVIRDLEGRFHVIFEDWSPINASKRSWDSPLAGHAVSENGVNDFQFLAPAVDNRTTPTGEIREYKHPHWLQHPDWDTNIAKYEVHEPEQEAYGDWAAIAVGGRYWLFGDYDPAGGHQMSVGWFTSPSLYEEFTWCDKIGNGHPDPDIGFAEGRFYLVTQQETDYVSPGPWTPKVEARIGVDAAGDGIIDQWTEWREVREAYSQREGFAKQIDKSPAALDAGELPAGRAFRFEFRVTDTTGNKSKPMLDRVVMRFE